MYGPKDNPVVVELDTKSLLKQWCETEHKPVYTKYTLIGNCYAFDTQHDKGINPKDLSPGLPGDGNAPEHDE